MVELEGILEIVLYLTYEELAPLELQHAGLLAVVGVLQVVEVDLLTLVTISMGSCTPICVLNRFKFSNLMFRA